MDLSDILEIKNTDSINFGWLRDQERPSFKINRFSCTQYSSSTSSEVQRIISNLNRIRLYNFNLPICDTLKFILIMLTCKEKTNLIKFAIVCLKKKRLSGLLSKDLEM